MIDVSVALAWVAISGVSLRWLSTLDHRSERAIPRCEGEPLHEDLYPLEFTPVYLGGPR